MPTTDPAAALAGAGSVVVAVPSHVVRKVVRSFRPLIPGGAVVVSAAKGIETDTLQRMSQVISAEGPDGVPVVVLSGPSFAVEWLVGCRRRFSRLLDAVAALQSRSFLGPSFRLYPVTTSPGCILRRAQECHRIAPGGQGLGRGHNLDAR